MKIDWAALGIVSVVSIAATLLFMTLLAFGVRFVSSAKVATNQGGRAPAPCPSATRSSASLACLSSFVYI